MKNIGTRRGSADAAVKTAKPIRSDRVRSQNDRRDRGGARRNGRSYRQVYLQRRPHVVGRSLAVLDEVGLFRQCGQQQGHRNRRVAMAIDHLRSLGQLAPALRLLERAPRQPTIILG